MSFDIQPYIPVVVGMITAASALSGVALNAFLTRQRENRKHSRDLYSHHLSVLITVYAECLTALDRMHYSALLWKEQDVDAMFASSKVELVCGEKVSQQLGITCAALDRWSAEWSKIGGKNSITLPGVGDKNKAAALLREYENERRLLSKAMQEHLALVESGSR